MPHVCYGTFLCYLLGAAEAFAVSTLGIRLDYCNSFQYGMMQRNSDELPQVQNTLACVVFQASGPNLIFLCFQSEKLPENPKVHAWTSVPFSYLSIYFGI